MCGLAKMTSGGVNSKAGPRGVAERRSNRRLQVALDIEVSLNGNGEPPRAAEKARTRNISPGDLFYESSLGDRLSVGDIVQVHIELPVNVTNIFSQRRPIVRGRVTRLEPPSADEPNRRGVAIRFLQPPTFQAPSD